MKGEKESNFVALSHDGAGDGGELLRRRASFSSADGAACCASYSAGSGGAGGGGGPFRVHRPQGAQCFSIECVLRQ